MKTTNDKLLGHARAILKPNMRHKWENGKVPKKETDNILDMIRSKQTYLSNIPPVEETLIQKTLTQKQWTRFAKAFINEVGGSKVDDTTGLTHDEFLDWIGHDLQIFEEYDWTPKKVDNDKLRAFINSLDYPKNKFEKLFKIT
jgi:hypothetical protein|tara:strand:- start:74 stop:502 length:429 start_codon:yes stop_codon:yes gene_type:complete